MSHLAHLLQSNGTTLLVLTAIALVFYAIARIMSARWHVALTFSTLPIIVFVFYTGEGGRLFAGIF